MSHLKQPLQIKNLTLKNRLVMPPMATAKSSVDGTVSPDLIDYYKARTQGEALGLVIAEHAYIVPAGKASAGQLSICKDEDIAGLRALSDSFHENNTPVFAQISHAGAKAKTEITHQEVLAPSAIRLPRSSADACLPRAFSLEEIQEIPALFAAAAKRAKEGGFDGVEIHCAHGYLLNQFYSPLSNLRTDEYGGSLENRIRLHLEVIKAVRNAVGDDYPIALRLGAQDYMEGGSSLQDAVYTAREFEKAGVDLLDISGGFCGYVRPGHNEPGYFADSSAAIKAAVQIPVLLTGGITQIEQAENLLNQKQADLIGVGRPLFKEAGWALKQLEKL